MLAEIDGKLHAVCTHVVIILQFLLEAKVAMGVASAQLQAPQDDVVFGGTCEDDDVCVDNSGAVHNICLLHSGNRLRCVVPIAIVQITETVLTIGGP